MKTTIILADNGKTIKKETDIACCLLARDFRGFNTYGINAVIEGGDNMEIKKGIIETLKDKYDLDFKCETENYVEWHQDGYLDVESRAYKEEKVAPTTTTKPRSKIINNLRIRKLTPKECFRLMGVRDEDINKIELSNSRLYHLAGDSIVVNVLMAIFSELL